MLHSKAQLKSKKYLYYNSQNLGHYAECRYDKFRSADCHGAVKIFEMLSDSMG